MHSTNEHNLKKGAICLLIGEAFIALMVAVIKKLSADIPNEALVFYRNIIGLCILLPIIFLDPRNDTPLNSLRTNHLPLHLIRCFFGVSAMYCFFYVIANIPLAEATLVKLSVPFFLPLITYFWLKETIQRKNKLAILIGFLGVLAILRPGTDQFNPIALIGVLGACFAAIAKVAIRRMNSTEPNTRIVFYFALLSSLITAMPLIWDCAHQHCPLPNTEQALWLGLLGILGTGGQLFMTQAYRIANPGKIGPYTYSSLIYATLLGWIFWGETLALPTIIGSTLIIYAGLLNLRVNDNDHPK